MCIVNCREKCRVNCRVNFGVEFGLNCRVEYRLNCRVECRLNCRTKCRVQSSRHYSSRQSEMQNAYSSAVDWQVQIVKHNLSTVQCSAVQCSAVQCSGTLHSAGPSKIVWNRVGRLVQLCCFHQLVCCLGVYFLQGLQLMALTSGRGQLYNCLLSIRGARTLVLLALHCSRARAPLPDGCNHSSHHLLDDINKWLWSSLVTGQTQRGLPGHPAICWPTTILNVVPGQPARLLNFVQPESQMLQGHPLSAYNCQCLSAIVPTLWSRPWPAL